MSFGRAVALWAAGGLAYGVGLVLLTLLLMAIKTGLHAHGPEYAGREIVWVWNQLPCLGRRGGAGGAGSRTVGGWKKIMATDFHGWNGLAD